MVDFLTLKSEIILVCLYAITKHLSINILFNDCMNIFIELLDEVFFFKKNFKNCLILFRTAIKIQLNIFICFDELKLYHSTNVGNSIDLYFFAIFLH